jgi:hypothetical protein
MTRFLPRWTKTLALWVAMSGYAAAQPADPASVDHESTGQECREMVEKLPSLLSKDDLECPGVLVFLERQTLGQCEALTQTPPPPESPDLLAELREMLARDQAVRANAGTATDADRAAWGFPTEQTVGREGVNAAWVIVQHVVGDLEFQQQVLDEIRARNLRWLDADVAMLTDKILVGKQAPQIYGSQYGWPIADPGHVDERRAQMGLMPLESYNCTMRKQYGH